MGVLPPTQDPGTPTPELRELLETMAELPRGADPQIKEFSADGCARPVAHGYRTACRTSRSEFSDAPSAVELMMMVALRWRAAPAP